MYRLFALWLSLVFLCLWIACCQSTPDDVCLPEPVIKVSLKSLRNQNGNWTTKVGLDRGGAQNLASVMDVDLWEIDLEADAKYCNGVVSSFTNVLTLTVPLPNIRSEPNVSSEPNCSSEPNVNSKPNVSSEPNVNSKPNVSSESTVTFKPNMSSDYELFPGVGYYKFNSVSTTWLQAKQICENENAHLLIINSERESEVAAILFARYPNIIGTPHHNNNAWIGVVRNGKSYLTIFGDSLYSTGFSKWGPGQPKGGSANCLLVERFTGDLYDMNCVRKAAFICERRL